jgi:SAM-dependent methyltransferase
MMKAEDTNRAHWDEIAPVHLNAYRVDRLLAGVSLIDEIQKGELYPIAGKKLLHLQCHIGTDTLSLALDGAQVTGVDFSPQSIRIARELAQQMGIQAAFRLANVLDLADNPLGEFDLVYTSEGVLCWISDIRRWAQVVACHLKPGGIFYIFESHPALMMFEDNQVDRFKIKYPYFHRPEPLHFEDDYPDYADSTYIPHTPTYEWQWSLADIVNALIGNGLTIELLNEHDRCFYKALPGMTRTPDGWWILEGFEGMIPMAFSLRARK